MSEIMKPIEFGKIIKWAMQEYNAYGRIFGIRKEKFYVNKANTVFEIFGEKLASAVGPAAGPNSQLTQNILAAYLAGSRLIELKTVQIMDGEELRNCVPRPCINAEDEGYNVEWSTELTVNEALEEYIKAHFAILVIAKELGLSTNKDFAFNMSVGYDLEGIKSEKINNFVEGLKDAKNTKIWAECKAFLLENVDMFKNVDKAFVENITSTVCTSITLSTLHGCPPDEIDRIARYLITEKKVHTYIKSNPTLLGYTFARNILDTMGYDYIAFDDHHFNNDLQYNDAVSMFKALQELAKKEGLEFGVKITNTFPVKIENNELPSEEMYMSGRSLFPLTISLCNKLSKDFNGTLPISYSGGADYFNIVELIQTGIKPITVATTILKPGGYERLHQLATSTEKFIGISGNINVELLDKMASNVSTRTEHLKEFRPVGSRKTDSILPLYDCFKAPCKDGGCPINQQIPEYLKLVAEGKFDEAFDLIAIDNANPAITGTICDHNCQYKCTRLDYEESLKIRKSKLIAVTNGQDKYIENIEECNIKSDKKVVIIGAGPAGVSTGLFLRRNGVDVTVLEKRDKPFGIVSYVIPEFRISSEMIKKDYDMAVKTGVKFVFNVNEKVDINALKKEYDYVVLAFGAWEKCASPVKTGGDKVIDALEFLEESKKTNLDMNLGKTVAIIGGGDVAMDCARASARTKGVEKAVIVYRRTKTYMPAGVEEINLAFADNVTLMELVAPVSYDGKTLVCEKMKLSERDASGRKGVVGTGEMVELAFDTVIAATGAKVNSSVFEENGLELNKWNCPVLTSDNESNIDNVYVAGDCKVGAATVVKAIADGKKIAVSILNKLSLENDFVRRPLTPDMDKMYDRKGVLAKASTDNNDGKRCLGCDNLCEICCDVCPNRANVSVLGHVLHIDDMCNECGNCGIFCPHTGNPYKDKITIFWSPEGFEESTNKGFMPLASGKYMIRNEEGKVFEAALGEGKISEKMEEIIKIVTKDYSYYLGL